MNKLINFLTNSMWGSLSCKKEAEFGRDRMINKIDNSNKTWKEVNDYDVRVIWSCRACGKEQVPIHPISMGISDKLHCYHCGSGDLFYNKTEIRI